MILQSLPLFRRKLHSFPIIIPQIILITEFHAPWFLSGTLGSRYMRLEFNDICPSITENVCGCCGDISGTETLCRVFMYNGESYEVPPEQMLVEAIVQGAFVDRFDNHIHYSMPKNLRDFFDGKESNIPMIRRCC